MQKKGAKDTKITDMSLTLNPASLLPWKGGSQKLKMSPKECACLSQAPLFPVMYSTLCTVS